MQTFFLKEYIFLFVDFEKKKRFQWKSRNDYSVRALHSNIMLVAFLVSSGTNFFSFTWVNQPFRDLTIQSQERLIYNPGFQFTDT